MQLLYLQILAALSSILVLNIAPKRSVKQPVSFKIKNENKIINSLILAPELLPALTLIKKENFASPTAGLIWEEAMSISNELGLNKIPEEIALLADSIKNDLEKKLENLDSITIEKVIAKYVKELAKENNPLLVKELSFNEGKVVLNWGSNNVIKMYHHKPSNKIEYEFTDWLEKVGQFSKKLKSNLLGKENLNKYLESSLPLSEYNEKFGVRELVLPESTIQALASGKSIGNKFDTIVTNELINNSYDSLESFKDDFAERYLKISLSAPSKNSPMHSLAKSLIPYYESLVISGGEVINDYMDRTQFNGNSEMVQTGVEARPIERKHTPYKISKKIAVMLITFVSTWANYGLVSNLNMPSSSKIILAVALMLLTSFSILWALVDIDTMYLDMPSFYLGLSVTWVMVAAGALSSGKLTHFLPGLTMTILMVFIFEVINLIYKKLRGSDGMGMGDTMIILGTIGVPTAISGAWQMGYRITMLSFLLGIVGWLYNKVTNNATKEEPFAFGPYLAVGWMLAVVTWQLTSGVLPAGF
jgi:prepilin signal peptidase PulO-like enzyme (type II secretory pathway)